MQFSLIILSAASLVINFAHAEPKVERHVTLVADAESGIDAYAQIRNVFGNKSIESPDLYPGNHPGFKHVRVNDDSEVGGCFKFYLHRDLDGDRHKSRSTSDRRRNEIKGYTGLPSALKATRGQVSRYRWMFRIDSDMKVTYQFCHIFQLKGIGGEDAGDPIFTISAAIRKGQLFLELRHWKGGDAPEEKFPLADLK